MILTKETIKKYQMFLFEEEKSQATIEKYIRDIQAFSQFLGDQPITKESVILYKQSLLKDYKTSSINSMLVAINSLLEFLGCSECKVKLLKVQRRLFCSQDKELTKDEYKRLLIAARKHNNERLYLLIQTICSTGIRVSELKFITVESLKSGKSIIRNKGKIREIFLPKELRKILLSYCRRRKIVSGSIFITKNGKPLNRSNIWSSMKALCQDAKVDKGKVFPHNLRHLFAFTYYKIDKDLVRLADILGHSNIETTRIYTMTTGNEYVKKLSLMGLVNHLC